MSHKKDDGMYWVNITSNPAPINNVLSHSFKLHNFADIMHNNIALC